MFIVDAHLDLAYNVRRGRDITLPAAEQPIVGTREPETATVGLPDLRHGRVGLICATIFCEPQTDTRPGYTDHAGALAQAREQLEVYRSLWRAYRLRAVLTAAQLPAQASLRAADPTLSEAVGAAADRSSCEEASIEESAQESAMPMILLMEGADAMSLACESEDASAAAWYGHGVRMVGLAWGRTRFAGGTGAPGPLAPDGRRLVAELDAEGFIHDASHLAEASLDELLSLARRPICATHSNCRSVVGDDPRGRHLSDRHVLALASRGGVIGVVLYDRFLIAPGELERRRATWADVVRHVDHICQLAGDCDHVGLGSDLDGGFGREHVPAGLTSAADLPQFGDALAAAGYADADVRKILGENWLGYFARSLPEASSR